MWDYLIKQNKLNNVNLQINVSKKLERIKSSNFFI